MQISSLMVFGITELRDIAFTGNKIRGRSVRKAIFEGIWKMPAMAEESETPSLSRSREQEILENFIAQNPHQADISANR